MKSFLDENFLLQTETAIELFHEHAKPQPVIDYHNHLPPEQVAGNHRFRSLTEIWLEGDHYKWRAMRASGVPERLVSGDGSDWEKFEAWARVVPETLRNPLFHWTAMELHRPFGIDQLLSPATAREVFDRCNERLRSEELARLGAAQGQRIEESSEILDQLVLNNEFVDFLTLIAYPRLP